jgi:hypothetical protein
MMKPKQVLELDGEAGEHVDQKGRACNGRLFEVTVCDVNDKDRSFGTLVQCATCLRDDLSVENSKVFDPVPVGTAATTKEALNV